MLPLAFPAFSATPTFNSDIAPILYQNCASCHRPGEVAPFPLLSYSDAARRAGLIATVTGKRLMPPWKPEPGYGHFADERRLSDAQVALIREWAANGAPEGNPPLKPVPPAFASGWQAGKPDVVLTLTKAFSIPADGPDLYECFSIPAGADTQRFVKSVEFRPGNRKVVHHALFFLDSNGEARKLETAAGGNGYPCFGGPQIQPSGTLGGWAPGAGPRVLPQGVAFTVAARSDVVIQIHYHPSGKPESDQSSLGITFGPPPTKGLASLIAGTRKIDLAPGVADQVVTDWVEAPEDSDLIGITPHAHLLCREMKVDAHLPDGATLPLLWIKDWDFNWQGQYRYAEPVHLPKGTRIEMRYTYDNSTGNIRNPSTPPRRVLYGEQTNDEMALLFLQVVLPHQQDVAAFRREFIASRLNRVITEGAEPAELNSKITANVRAAATRFDANHNGKLDPDELTRLLRLLVQISGR